MAEQPPDIEEVFGLVAHDVRFGILRALWDARGNGGDSLSFSSLFDAVDISDSGQFNYHLDKLTPRFVREGEDGYELAYAGEQVIGAATSGTYTLADSVSMSRTAVGDCPECDGTVGAAYEEGHVEVTCDGCELTVLKSPVPPVLAAGYETEELPVVFSRYTLTKVQELDRGFCPLCGGRVDASLERTDQEGDRRLVARHACRECGESYGSLVVAATLDHPAVIGFLYDHGMDVRQTPLWELDPLFGGSETVLEEDPLRVEVTMTFEEESIELTLDAELTILEHDRRTKP